MDRVESCPFFTSMSNSTDPPRNLGRFPAEKGLPEMGDTRQTRIGILVYNGVDLLDVSVPYELFQWAAEFDETLSLSVHVVAENRGPVTSHHGFRFEVDEDFRGCPQLDVVWVAGAKPQLLAKAMKNEVILDFLRAQAQSAAYVVSVCNGALILASAGLLDGYEATTNWAYLPCFERYPAIRVAEGYPRYVVCRDRITGAGPSSGLDEALKIIALLRGDDAARQVQLTIQYHPDPPFHCGDPDQCGRPPATCCPISP
jgi:transcriptional regulator GlxA family with amidase domain